MVPAVSSAKQALQEGIDIWANFGTHYFLERREICMFNIGKDSTRTC